MEQPESENINASEIDEETKEKLKGDMIGDTLYRESFVIKVLMSLSDLKYTEEMEEDLCFLWDMTIEKDVCKYLFHLQYPSLATTALDNCTEKRFIEIIIGILANILLADCEKNITNDEIERVLKEFNTDDSAVLVQLVRFIEAISYSLPDRVCLLEVAIREKIVFILNYSQSSELITQTLQALVRLTEDYKLGESEVNSQLFEAVVEGFDTVFSVEKSNFEIDTEETSKIVKLFLSLVVNMCAYAQKYQHNENDIPTSISNCGKLSATLCRILRHFSEEGNLFPVTPDFDVYLSAIHTIITTRDVTLVQDLHNRFFEQSFNYLCKTLYLLHSSKSETLDSYNLVLEIIGSLIHLVDEQVVLSELKHVRYKRGIVVLNSLKESSRTFDFDISSKLRMLFSEFK